MSQKKGSISKDVRERIEQHWNKHTIERKNLRLAWWQSPLIVGHINSLICGEPCPRNGEGLIRLATRVASGKSFDVGISVGCGNGNKELAILKSGLVKRFILFELSSERIKRGKSLAERMGLQDRVEFRNEDAFAVDDLGGVDFVHWSGALHHMMDVDDAVRWSRNILQPGGMFCMQDFVGPTRWQWSDKSLAIATQVRSALPKNYLRNPWYPERGNEFLRAEMKRPSAEGLEATDPSEAADSGRIVESLRRYFPEAQLILLGGVIYHLVLRYILDNFNEEDEYDRALLSQLLIQDELCIEIEGLESHYAAAVAIKES